MIVSWHPDEQPSRDEMLLVAETTLNDIGLGEHQALIVGHADTPNRHMHVMVNRVNPDTGVAWSTSHDYRRIEQSMRRQSEQYGFIMVPGRHTEPAAFETRARTRSEGEFQMLRNKGREALPQWSKDESRAIGDGLKPAIDKARSWHDLVQSVEEFGGALVPKGQGLVITDHARTGYAKLSSLGANVRMKELEARFGQTWRDHAATQIALPKLSSIRPLVTEMDIVLSLYRAGLAQRSDVQGVVDDRRRKLEEAPVAVRIEQEMRQALRAATSKPARTRKARAGTRPKDQDPEPQK